MDGKPKSKSLRSYSSTVFKESSVSAVSGVVSDISRPRKIFRVVIFLLFTAAFLYQVIKFLCYVLEYPTVVDVSIVNPDSYLTPAFTFCSNNKIKRSKFCAKYPDLCIEPDFELCEKRPHYCGVNMSMIPKPEYYASEISMPKDEMLELGDNISVLFTQDEKVEEPQGPHFRARELGQSVSICYSLNSRVDNPLAPRVTQQKNRWNSPLFRVNFDVEESDTFHPNTQPGILFSLHSPFDAVNPFKNGIFLQPGRMYKVFFKMQEERLLPYPYKTDCVNYTAIWEKNNRTGPRSQDMCTQKCIMELFQLCFKCTWREVTYPYEGKTCDRKAGDMNKVYCDSLDQQECFEGCKDDCSKMKYTFDVRQRFVMEDKIYSDDFDSEDRSIYVEVELEDEEILTLYHKPQYQEVEAFSYIGGFIGIWLGISLIQVADFIESVFRIIRYYFKKKRSSASPKSPVDCT